MCYNDPSLKNKKMDETFTPPNDSDITVPEVKSVVDRFDTEPILARHQRWREVSNLKKGAAIVATAIAMGTGLTGTANASNTHTKSPAPETERILGTDGEQNNRPLRDLEDLPGYSMRISPKARKDQLASTVKILDDKGRYQCTGTLTSYGKKVLIATASHCFDNDITKASGGLINRHDYAEPIRSAASGNILATSGAPEYYISIPSMHNRGDLRPDGTVKAIAVSLDGDVDLALAEFNFYGWGSAMDKSVISPLMELPVMPLEDFMSMSELPGQETAQVGIPQTTNGKPVTTIGRYLGIIDDQWGRPKDIPAPPPYSGQSKQQFAVVAIHVPSSKDPLGEPDRKRDACFFGASGSGAKLASGKILLGLARRLEKSTSYIRSWELTEQALGVKIPEKYNVLCFYSVPTAETLKKIVEGIKVPLNFDHALATDDNYEYHRQLTFRKYMADKYIQKYLERSIGAYDNNGQQIKSDPNQKTEELISKINIDGDAKFISKTGIALRIMSLKTPEQFSEIIPLITHITKSDAGMAVFIGGGGWTINSKYSNTDPITFAHKLAKVVYTSKLTTEAITGSGNGDYSLTTEQYRKIEQNASDRADQILLAMGAYHCPELDD